MLTLQIARDYFASRGESNCDLPITRRSSVRRELAVLLL